MLYRSHTESLLLTRAKSPIGLDVLSHTISTHALERVWTRLTYGTEQPASQIGVRKRFWEPPYHSVCKVLRMQMEARMLFPLDLALVMARELHSGRRTGQSDPGKGGRIR